MWIMFWRYFIIILITYSVVIVWYGAAKYRYLLFYFIFADYGLCGIGLTEPRRKIWSTFYPVFIRFLQHFFNILCNLPYFCWIISIFYPVFFNIINILSIYLILTLFYQHFIHILFTIDIVLIMWYNVQDE